MDDKGKTHPDIESCMDPSGGTKPQFPLFLATVTRRGGSMLVLNYQDMHREQAANRAGRRAHCSALAGTYSHGRELKPPAAQTAFCCVSQTTEAAQPVNEPRKCKAWNAMPSVRKCPARESANQDSQGMAGCSAAKRIVTRPLWRFTSTCSARASACTSAHTSSR